MSNSTQIALVESQSDFRSRYKIYDGVGSSLSEFSTFREKYKAPHGQLAADPAPVQAPIDKVLRFRCVGDSMNFLTINNVFKTQETKLLFEITEQFTEFYNQWQIEIKYKSNVTKIIGNQNYLNIIELGKPVLPLIFQKYQEKNDFWSFALRSITGKNVNEESFKGNREQIRNAWIRWGEENKYV